MSGKYRLVSHLGEGNSSKVFLAVHRKLNTYRAVKCVKKTQSGQPQLLLEADILKNLKHPGIPTIYDVEEDDKNYYIIEEYIQGQSLEAFVLHQDCISIDTAVHMMLQICDVIKYLHDQKPEPVIYQDLKPEHIILCGKRVVLIDFGISSYITSNGNTFQNFGTEGFAPPEKYQGMACDIQTDIYGIGKILAFLASRMPEHEFRILQPLIGLATAYAKEDRYESVEALEADLRQALENGSQHIYQTTKKRLLSKTAGITTAGTETAGIKTEGTGTAGIKTEGTGTAGIKTGGTGTAGITTEGTGTAGIKTEGTGTAGITTEGTETAGIKTGGTGTAGIQTAGTETEKTKISVTKFAAVKFVIAKTVAKTAVQRYAGTKTAVKGYAGTKTAVKGYAGTKAEVIEIAVAGTQSRVGTTHLAIALTCFFNQEHRHCIYQECHPSDCIRLLASENTGYLRADGLVAYEKFRGMPYYGEGIAKQEQQKGLYIQDYGIQLQDILEENKKLILIMGSRPWEYTQTENLLRKISLRRNLVLVCNYADRSKAKILARTYHHRVYCFPLDADPFRMTREKRKLFQKMLRQEGW